MRYFGFNNMDDDEFRKEFIRFLNEHQRKMSDFMKQMYGVEDSPKIKKNYDLKDYLDLLAQMNLKDINREKGEDEFGSWEQSNWISPDGTSRFSSFSRDFNPYKYNNFREEEETKLDTMDLLEKKLNKSIMIEDYESAAKIRDLIKSLGEKSKK